MKVCHYELFFLFCLGSFIVQHLIDMWFCSVSKWFLEFFIFLSIFSESGDSDKDAELEEGEIESEEEKAVQ